MNSYWIPVSDSQLPEHDKDDLWVSVRVMLWVPRFAHTLGNGAHVFGRYLFYAKKFRPEGSGGCEDLVTHWRYLPDGPEGK
jgi:Protein of unknown function (DUF551)